MDKPSPVIQLLRKMHPEIAGASHTDDNKLNGRLNCIPPNASSIILVTNVPPSCTKNDLHKIFSKYGNLREVQVEDELVIINFMDINVAAMVVTKSLTMPFFIGQNVAKLEFAQPTASMIIQSLKKSDRINQIGVKKTGEMVSKVLDICIENVQYPIDITIIKSVCSKYDVKRIVIGSKDKYGIVEALVEFASEQSSIAAKKELHNAEIYSGCCKLSVHYSPLTMLHVARNGLHSWDKDLEMAVNDGGISRSLHGFDEQSLYEQQLKVANEHTSSLAFSNTNNSIGKSNSSMPDSMTQFENVVPSKKRRHDFRVPNNAVQSTSYHSFVNPVSESRTRVENDTEICDESEIRIRNELIDTMIMTGDRVSDTTHMTAKSISNCIKSAICQSAYLAAHFGLAKEGVLRIIFELSQHYGVDYEISSDIFNMHFTRGHELTTLSSGEIDNLSKNDFNGRNCRRMRSALKKFRERNPTMISPQDHPHSLIRDRINQRRDYETGSRASVQREAHHIREKRRRRR